MSEQDARLATWLAPIPGERAEGEDARNDPDHERVRTEIGKLASLSGDVVDWAEVVSAAGRVLDTKSKDLALGVYLARGLHECEGTAGLATGLRLVAGLLHTYSKALHPTKPRARANALQWFYERTAEKLPLTVATGPEAAVLAAGCTELASSVLALLGEQAPPATELLSNIEHLLKTAAGGTVARPPEPERPALPEPTGLPESSASVSLRAPVSAPSELSGLPSFLKTTGEALIDVAKTLGELDRSAPLSYWLLRTGLWLHLERVPADQDGRTRIPAPDRRAREGLDALLANQKWEQAIAQSEALLRRCPFWLDSHRLTDEALHGLGEKYADAQRAVSTTARAFVQRLPRLLQLSFADDSPLANPATAAWLRGPQVREQSDGLGSQSDLTLPPELLGALQRGDTDAFAAFTSLVKGAASMRQAFCLRLALGRALLEARRTALAVTVLLGLERDLDRFQLEEWEPSLALETLIATRAALAAQIDPSKGEPPELRRICSRLARLAPSMLA